MTGEHSALGNIVHVAAQAERTNQVSGSCTQSPADEDTGAHYRAIVSFKTSLYSFGWYTPAPTVVYIDCPYRGMQSC